MGTTLNNAKLTVRVIEEITLNGAQKGSTNKHELIGINEISERIMSIPTSPVTVLSSSYSVGAGTYVSSSIKYIRLTNLDDTNFLRISFTSGSTDKSNTADLKLDAQRSMIFTNTSISGSSKGEVFGSFSNFTDLKASADTAAVDLEIFVAST